MNKTINNKRGDRAGEPRKCKIHENTLYTEQIKHQHVLSRPTELFSVFWLIQYPIDSAGIYPWNNCHHTSKPANNFFSVRLSYLRSATRLDLIAPHAASLVREKRDERIKCFSLCKLAWNCSQYTPYSKMAANKLFFCLRINWPSLPHQHV